MALELASSLTQGSNDLAEKEASVKQRLPMSPFGSMTIDGMLSMAASSMRSTPSPVLPEPVIPMIAACVVKFLFFKTVSSSVVSKVDLSTSFPK